jgi:hypothetical protein
LRSNTLRACRTLLRAKPIRTSDGVLELLGALKTPQFPTVGATQATVIGLLLKLLQARLVALRVWRRLVALRVLRRLLGALRVLRRLLGALELAELAPLDAAQTAALGLQLLQPVLRLVGGWAVAPGRCDLRLPLQPAQFAPLAAGRDRGPAGRSRNVRRGPRRRGDSRSALRR